MEPTKTKALSSGLLVILSRVTTKILDTIILSKHIFRLRSRLLQFLFNQTVSSAMLCGWDKTKS